MVRYRKTTNELSSGEDEESDDEDLPPWSKTL